MDAYKPNEVGTFSFDKHGKTINVNSAKYPELKSFQLPLDLNEGYDRVAEEESYRVRAVPTWEIALDWIRDTGYDSVADIDIITRRGILTKIGNTPCNYFKNAWEFEACKYKGKIYIRDPIEKDCGKEDSKMSDWRKINSYWGSRFENYVTDQEEDVKASYRVLKGTLGKNNVLLTVQVDAVKTNGEYLEIKTCFKDKFRRNIATTWLQSYLGKSDVLYVGYKSKEGMIERDPEEFKLSEIPQRTGGNLSMQNANKMINFIGKIMDQLRSTIEEEDVTWSLVYSEGASIKDVKLSKKRDTGTGFFPDWYRAFVTDSIERQNSLEDQLQGLSLEHRPQDQELQ